MEQRLLMEVLPQVVQPHQSTGTQAGDCQSFPITIQPLWVALEMRLMKMPPHSFMGTRSKPPGHTEPEAAELHVVRTHPGPAGIPPVSKPTLLLLPPCYITIISSFNKRASVTLCSKRYTHHLMENHLLVDVFLSLLFVGDHPSPRFTSGRPPTDEFSKPRQLAGR